MIDTSDTLRPSLSIESLAVRYPGRRAPALADVSLGVPAGEMVAVVGRNGAGKSTLCLAAAGFVPRVVKASVSGQVLIGDLDVTRAPLTASAGKVGICFSTPALQLSASKPTVREELAFGLENLAVPQAAMAPRIDRVLEQLAIGDLAERAPLSLSGGEQQRVAIASILVMGTGVIVLDEPTAQLDPAGSQLLAELMAELAGSGRAVLVAEHATEVLARASRGAALHGGGLVAAGAPAEAVRAVAAAAGDPLPTLVQLASVIGVPAAEAFDESKVAAALRGWQPDAASRLAESGRVPTAGREPMDAPQPIAGTRIELRDIVHRYANGIEAVRGVSLQLDPGQRTAIIGQNGSGKTTLVKHLNGLLRPLSGDVLIDGRAIAGLPISSLARQVGFVFQSPDDQLFNASLEREIAFGPRNLGLPASEVSRRVASALETTTLADERETNPFDLGHSARKLVALASVLAMEPAALVLDEPTSGQDAAGRALVGRIIDTWAATGRVVVATTHDMEFAARHFDRVLVMRGGQVVLDGSARDVFGAGNATLLATAGVRPPPAARLAHALGVAGTPLDAGELVDLLRERRSARP